MPKKGSSWSPEEDELLAQMVARDGSGNWDDKATELGTDRTGNSCRDRYQRLTGKKSPSRA